LTIDFGCVLSYLDKKLNKGERMTEVTWKEKKYVIPFEVNLEWDKNQEIEVTNRFGGDSCKLPWFAVAIYDLILGAESFEDWNTHREGLDWFIENFPNEYMVLLD
jgi:hypothetical protein